MSNTNQLADIFIFLAVIGGFFLISLALVTIARFDMSALGQLQSARRMKKCTTRSDASVARRAKTRAARAKAQARGRN